ncbi:Protein of unknown function [Blastococcus saxobsidens DD2]|uniref:Uncharacterized protein n=1 Tax=Blastococcus saxobsidens (strain DD2) TaxID=1146883 RepID=H6RMZ8_BLASD|nr:Protein of unknown function [Blastococcus saxobsidens DD2]
MTWVVMLPAVWVIVAIAAGVVIGRGVRLADAEAARVGRAEDDAWVPRVAAGGPARLVGSSSRGRRAGGGRRSRGG